MPNTPMLAAKGLFTFANFLSAIPEGSLLDATNVVIDRDGIIEPRRGIHAYGDIDDFAQQVLTYKDRILAHFGTTLAYDNGTGIFTDFASSFPAVQTGRRIRNIELNGNNYVTTADGIKKIASASDDLSMATISFAGGVKAIDGEGTVNYSTPGFFSGLSKVAYRIVWGTKDINDNLILGSPSSQIVLTNFSTQSGTVDLTFAIPDEITTDYFYQIYRTQVSTAPTLELVDALSPLDEMKLVIETAVTPTDISNQFINVNDITPEAFQQGGTFLYTNQTSGDGILQANEKPPVAIDIAIFKNSAFYANTRTKHSLDVSLLGLAGVGSGGITNITPTNPAVITSDVVHNLQQGDLVAIVGSGGSVDGVHIVTVLDGFNFTIPVTGVGATAGGSWFSSYITVVSGITTNRYFFVGRPEVTAITFDTQANTLDGSYFTISASDDTTQYAVWFDKTGTTTAPSVPGFVLIRVNISAVGIGVNVSPTVLSSINAATNDFAIDQTSGIVLTFITANNGPATNAAAGTPPPGGTFAISVTQQGFGEDLTRNYVRLSGFISAAQAVDDTARSLVRVINNNNSEVIYGYYLSGPTDVPGLMHFERRILTDVPFTMQANNAAVGALFNPDLTVAATSTDEEAQNRLYFSKYQQPEAVPIVNYIDIGPKDKAILRIIPLRDSLFIFKQDAIYRLTGDISPNFSVILFDNSVKLIAPDSPAVLNNQIYCLTDGGIATVTETGVGIVSRPIENIFMRVNTDNFPNFQTASFGVSYETERSYYIWTVTNQTDTYATQCFRYNTFTQCWTRWDKPQTCAIVNQRNNKLHFGSPLEEIIEVERKTLTRTDFADKDFALSIPSNAITDHTMAVSSVSDLAIGDIIVQTQYLTENMFNSLLKKLDLDPRIGLTPGSFDDDYLETLEMVAGDNLTNKMTQLVAKLNADPGTNHGYVFTGTTNFVTIQTEFNTMITALNADTLLKFNNYQHSVGTNDFELTIISLNKNQNTISSDSMPPFIVGPILAFKGIKSSIIWAPFLGGDPSLLKHFREATMLFEASNFRGGIVSYNSDLSPSFESITFEMDGNGVWGGFVWGATTWGGGGTSTPFRTIIPRQKQRCRYIRSKFNHNDAFYKFSILGISYTYEISSERAYRSKR